METAPCQRGAGEDSSQPVIGSIQAASSDLADHVAGWLQHLRSRRHKPNGFNCYRQRVERMIRETGVRRCDELTSAVITGWLDSHSESWTGSTYNNALSVLRSLTGYLARVGAIAEDPLEGSVRAYEEYGAGSRAATTEEARSILSVAVARTLSDRRCKGERALYWACLFLAGCRLDEPGRWRWKHLLLDESVPVIRWTPDISKNRRLEETAIAPELAHLLRAHRDAAASGPPESARLFKGKVVEVRRIRPDDPEAFVFGTVPTPASFPKDRDRAGVAKLDARQRPLTAHSARKWFATTLTLAGVHSRIVDRLMRHKGGVQGRYFDPPMGEQAEAVALLPRLWPIVDNRCTSGVRRLIIGESLEAGLTESDGVGRVSHRANDPDPSHSVSRPGPDRVPHRWHDDPRTRPGLNTERTPGQPGERVSESHRVESPRDLSQEMALPQLINATDSTAVADLLNALARLLRQGAAHAELEQPHRSRRPDGPRPA